MAEGDQTLKRHKDSRCEGRRPDQRQAKGKREQEEPLPGSRERPEATPPRAVSCLREHTGGPTAKPFSCFLSIRGCICLVETTLPGTCLMPCGEYQVSYCASKEMPVSEIHVHLLLQLVHVALRQHAPIDVGLRTRTEGRGVTGSGSLGGKCTHAQHRQARGPGGVAA